MKAYIRCVLAVTLLAFFAAEADAKQRGARGQSRNHVNNVHRTQPHHNANHNKNVNVNNNRNVNINQNKNVNVNVDVNHRGGYYGGCCYHNRYHPVATAAAVTATAIVVGSIVNSLPPSCSTVVVNGFAYQQCGNTWYQPQISGSSTTYIVVNSPY